MKIKKIIFNAIEDIVGGRKFLVEHPVSESMGDYASNVALLLSKEVGKSPRELAYEMVEKLNKNKELMEIVKGVEVAGPGFINFTVKDEVLVQSLLEMSVLKERCLDADYMLGKKVLIEYSSPNIAKRFSVGHLRSTIIGQAIYNLYYHSGAEVVNDNHLGDWGTQFGMIIAAVEEKGVEVSKLTVSELENLYVDFNKEIEAKPELRDKARDAFVRLEKGEDNARKIWKECVAVSMKEFDRIYEKLGVSFKYEYGESSYESEMPEIISEMLRLGVAQEGERGALIVKFEKDGKEYMPPAMLRKADGTTTYFTRDLATIRKRLDDPSLKSDMYIYEVGSEQTLHFRQVFEASRMIWDDAKTVDFVHVPHGLMTFGGEKMSTRKGTTIKLEDLLFRSQKEAVEKAMEKSGEEANEELREISERVSIGAVKYNELKRSHDTNYDFRWEEALSMEGNSGPYMQYAYVRTNGILSKAKKSVMSKEKWLDLNEDERSLARFLALRFGEGEVVENAARNFGPHLLCQALFELSQRFNGFYDRNRVVGTNEEAFRLLLVAVTGHVIKSGLNILGIETVAKM